MRRRRGATVAASKKPKEDDGYYPHRVAESHREAIAKLEAASAPEADVAERRTALAKAEKDADLLDRWCDHFRGDE